VRVCVCVCVCVSEGEGNLLATHTIKTDVYCIRIQLQTYVFRRNVLGDKSKLRDHGNQGNQAQDLNLRS
jgi:hypothetical protein